MGQASKCSFGSLQFRSLLNTLVPVPPNEFSLTFHQWEFQDPIDGGTLVPYVWPYFVGISPYIGLKNRPCHWFQHVLFPEKYGIFRGFDHLIPISLQFIRPRDITALGPYSEPRFIGIQFFLVVAQQFAHFPGPKPGPTFDWTWGMTHFPWMFQWFWIKKSDFPNREKIATPHFTQADMNMGHISSWRAEVSNRWMCCLQTTHLNTLACIKMGEYRNMVIITKN